VHRFCVTHPVRLLFLLSLAGAVLLASGCGSASDDGQAAGGSEATSASTPEGAASSDDIDAEDADAEDADAEDAGAEDADAEDAGAEDADAEDADAVDSDSEDVGSTETEPLEADPGETDSNEAATEAAAATTSSAPPSAATGDCGSGGSIAEGRQELTFTTSTGVERTYDVALPTTYSEGTPSSVVFNFHGRGSNSFQQYVYGNFIAQAEADNVSLVMPQALERGENEAVQGDPGEVGNNLDLDFIAELVEQLQSDYCTDRFFSAGMSSGGFMTSALACWADSPFEGFGPVTLAFYDDEFCSDAGPRPTVYFHGTDDETVPFDGTATLDPAPTSSQEWADHNGCDPEPIEERIGTEIVHYSWQNCEAPTDFYVVEGGAHTWPGSLEIEALGYVTQEISASDLIWELFFGSE